MDLDGTLIDGFDSIQPKTKEALLFLQDKGVQLILASGRPYKRLMGVAKELKMDQYGGYLIEMNGIGYYDIKNKERVILSTLDGKDVFLYIMEKGFEVHACCDQTLYDYIPSSLYPIKEKLRKEMKVDANFPWTCGPWTMLFDMRKAFSNIVYIQTVDEIKENVFKIQTMDSKERIEDLYHQLMKKYSNSYEIFRTSYRQVEILPKGIHKGSTLKKIMERNHWSKEDGIAFGDGENDVSLFQTVALSVAMGQAEEYVKKEADYVTSSNNEEGIYNALVQLGYMKETV